MNHPNSLASPGMSPPTVASQTPKPVYSSGAQQRRQCDAISATQAARLRTPTAGDVIRNIAGKLHRLYSSPSSVVTTSSIVQKDDDGTTSRSSNAATNLLSQSANCQRNAADGSASTCPAMLALRAQSGSASESASGSRSSSTAKGEGKRRAAKVNTGSTPTTAMSSQCDSHTQSASSAAMGSVNNNNNANAPAVFGDKFSTPAPGQSMLSTAGAAPPPAVSASLFAEYHANRVVSNRGEHIRHRRIGAGCFGQTWIVEWRPAAVKGNQNDDNLKHKCAHRSSSCCSRGHGKSSNASNSHRGSAKTTTSEEELSYVDVLSSSINFNDKAQQQSNFISVVSARAKLLASAPAPKVTASVHVVGVPNNNLNNNNNNNNPAKTSTGSSVMASSGATFLFSCSGGDAPLGASLSSHIAPATTAAAAAASASASAAVAPAVVAPAPFGAAVAALVEPAPPPVSATSCCKPLVQVNPGVLAPFQRVFVLKIEPKTSKEQRAAAQAARKRQRSTHPIKFVASTIVPSTTGKSTMVFTPSQHDIDSGVHAGFQSEEDEDERNEALNNALDRMRLREQQQQQQQQRDGAASFLFACSEPTSASWSAPPPEVGAHGSPSSFSVCGASMSGDSGSNNDNNFALMGMLTASDVPLRHAPSLHHGPRSPTAAAAAATSFCSVVSTPSSVSLNNISSPQRTGGVQTLQRKDVLIALKEHASVTFEGSVLKNCAHPNIVGFVDEFEDETNRYLVMEYVDGGDLREEVQRRAQLDMDVLGGSNHLLVSSVLFLWVQALCAVEYLHRHNILHRDIKTANLLFSKKWRVLLADFGFARDYGHDIDEGNATITAHGTPHYMAPEMFQRQPICGKVDIWALGVVLFELLALTRPFEQGNDSAQDVAARVIGRRHPSVNSFRPPHLQVPPDIVALLDAMLKKNPRQRPTAKQLMRMPVVSLALDEYKAKLKSAAQQSTQTIDMTLVSMLEEHVALVRGDELTSAASRRRQAEARREELSGNFAVNK